MKIRNSLRSLRQSATADNRLVRRKKGRVYVINKTQRRFQGAPKVDVLRLTSPG